MPSTSPGSAPPASFEQIFPGAPTESLQSFTTFTYRFRRYVAYISGCQLAILASPNDLIQAITFDHSLHAVAAEKDTGKIAVGGKQDACVLQPLTEGWDRIWWEKALSLQREDAGDQARRLSWGNEGELLVGGSHALSLFSSLPSSRMSSPATPLQAAELVEERRALWSKEVSSSILFADFSPSASIIASCAAYDRLVKIWRRLSYEEGLFDYAYLPHTGPVTHVQWRPMDQHSDERRGSGISGRHDEDPEVLHTISDDGLLRVWRTGGLHDLEIMVLHASIDLGTAIPQSPTLTSNGLAPAIKPPRYAFIIPSDQFCGAVKAASGVLQNGRVNHAMEHLKEMASKEPDVIVALDGHGRMSAWGLQSIGHKRRPDTPSSAQAFHIAHAEDLPFRFPSPSPTAFHAWFQDGAFHILVHALTSSKDIKWWRGTVDTFFSPSVAGPDRLDNLSVWGGHEDEVVALEASHERLVSWSAQQVCLWKAANHDRWECCHTFTTGARVLSAAWLPNTDVVLVAETHEFVLYNLEGARMACATCKGVQSGKIHVLKSDQGSVSGVFIQGNGEFVPVWFTELSNSTHSSVKVALNVRTISLPRQATVNLACPIAATSSHTGGKILQLDERGALRSFVMPDVASSEIDGETIAAVETGVAHAKMLTADKTTAVIASGNGREVVIVDLTAGYIEHRQVTKEPVTHVACFIKHNLIAIGYGSQVDILVRGRYEHSDSQSPIWVPIRTISILRIGLRIGALAWTTHGSLAIATGNAVFLTSSALDCGSVPPEMTDALGLDADRVKFLDSKQLSQMTQCPLPVWHPALLSYLVRDGRCGLAASLLNKLSRLLKFWSAGDPLSPDLDEPMESFVEHSSVEQSLSESDYVNDLPALLDEKDLPGISRLEQRLLRCIVQAIKYIRDHEDGLDVNAVRYLFSWKLQLLLEVSEKGEGVQANGDHAEEECAPRMKWREIAFAHQSTTQQPLLDILILHHNNKLTWPIARRLGIMAWISERQALELVFEQLAQSAYRSSQPADPVNGALYFLALQKKPTLLALWRIATWHKEQRSTMNFLKRDFNQPDARTAAKKNAYALMGKRRFEYAAAFFLLANDPASAISLLAGQCEDAQLAIAVARLYCGEGSPVLRNLLEDRVLPKARQSGDRWLESWCHQLLLEGHDAAQALVKPLDGVRTWSQDDPALMLLYRDVRQAPSEHEYGAILRSARILKRMGLWLPALELVSRWQFKHVRVARVDTDRPAATNGVSNGVHEDAAAPATDPTSLLDSFQAPGPSAEAVVDERAAREAKAAELLKKLKAKKEPSSTAAAMQEKTKKPEPTQFKEPDAGSLLDSFGL